MISIKRAILAIVGSIALVVAVFLGTAYAIPQSNPSFPTVTCGGQWHWVHNQLPAGTTTGTLTATFQFAGTKTVTGTLNPGGATVHYRLNLPAGDTLVSASDTINGGKLLLSDFPTCATPSGSQPPSSVPPSSPRPS